ncbi:uncharacterized protein LOC128555225 [Mercenaria mercenaria]|uniref:uncharacterized protein LOC128555225 n=1 Tax=Mercenaria mercenaria TaxID=6596 RepID=UPI00234F384C|nr:uncharacterized protein LOC128555225 [Mercenaria mercenaria]
MALRLKYSPSKMKQAIASVKSGTLSRRKAAELYGIPKTTLLDKLSGRSPEERVRPGPATVLTEAEENVLCDYIKLMASIGYPVTRDELLTEVKKVIDLDGRNTPFRNNKPGKDWFYAFRRRHPDLSERSAMCLGHHRAVVNMAMIQGWFDGLVEHLQSEVQDYQSLLKDPRRLFNCDESGFPLCLKTGKVLAERGARHVYHVSSSNKQQITVMVCFSAFGNYVPPLIVYPGERFRDTGIEAFPTAIYGHTHNGWMDSELFVAFLEHFSSYVDHENIPKPVLLFVDGHSTHMSRDAATYCANNGIILYCLLPNATHILQPCDVGFFSPMKSAWKKNLKHWQLENIGETLTKRQFPAVFKSAWETVSTLENAAHGFRRSGLYPLDPNGIDKTKLEPSKIANPPRMLSTCQDTSSVLKEQDTKTADANDLPGPSGDSLPIKDSPSDSGNSFGGLKQVSDSTCDINNTNFSQCTESMTASISPSLTSSKGRQSLVSESFRSLSVPVPKQRRQSSTFFTKLPKALSGSAALRMFEEREEKKKADVLAKQKRQEERELKKKMKQEMQEQKRKEKADKKQKREEEKKLKLAQKGTSKQKRRRNDSSSSESNDENKNIKLQYQDSDDSYNEKDLCPGCLTDDVYEDDEEWVKCAKCPRRWHVSCTGDAVLLDIPVGQLSDYPFHCEYCV